MEWVNEKYTHLTLQYLELMRYTHWLNKMYALVQCVYLVNFSEPVQYVIYMHWLSFYLRCESGTCNSYTMARVLCLIYTHKGECVYIGKARVPMV